MFREAPKTQTAEMSAVATQKPPTMRIRARTDGLLSFCASFVG